MGEQAANWNTVLEHAALSDIGLRRSNNQDSHAVVLAGDAREWRERGHLFMVADGMGAHAAGELASKMACNGVPHTYHKLRDRVPGDAIRQAVLDANANIHERGQANVEFLGMGTTCSTLLIMPQGAVIAHVGDSRIYRLRGGEQLDQLTFDHSLVWEMMAAGQMPKGDSANFVPKNIITRSLGPHAEVRVDLEGPFPLEVGDTFLLCSDGLSGQVGDEEIGLILATLTPTEAVRALIDLANLRGGPDNITVIVVRILLAVDPSTVVAPTVAPGPKITTNPAWWVALGVCVLFAVGLLLAHQLVPAAIAGLGAIVVAMIVLLQRAASGSDQPIDGPHGPYGKGPHTSRECVANASAVAVFAQIVEKLGEASVDEHWTLDWQQINAQKQRAADAASASDFGTAVREYCLTISFMMNEIRQQKSRRTDADHRSTAES